MNVRAVVPLIRAKLTPELLQLMTEELKIAAVEGKGKCVLLVDEIMKAEKFGVGFANQVRTAVCQWMDKKICKVVLFSSLDAKFLTEEFTASGRAVSAVTTLPLLNLAQSISFFNDEIKVDFIDGEGNIKIRKIFINNLLSPLEDTLGR